MFLIRNLALPVKKYFAISLFCIYLFSTTEMNQLLKMPLLIEHYFDHKEENKDLTLFQYLNMHYTNPHPVDKNHEKDLQLPFKSHSDCSSAVSGNFILSERITLERPETETKRKRGVYKNQFLFDPLLAKILQPPRPYLNLS